MADQDPLYLRYRPKKLADVVGQDTAVRILTNSFKTKKMHHAYVMAGKHGCGKTTCARIVAAMLNCEKGPSIEPCGVCKNCKEIFAGRSLDVKEIDGGSNRSIDDVRELKKEVYFAPVSCRKRLVIIDEAHRLTGAAAEALLKVLEEPPPHVIFILCTTEPEALKPTIHSRCIGLTYKPIAWMVLFGLLKDVASKEGIKADEAALKFIAKSGRGSARDSLQNLQMSADFAGDETLTIEFAEQALGGIDDGLYFKLIESIGKSDVPSAWKLVNKLMLKGRNSESIVKGLETYLCNLMMISLCGSAAQDMGFTEAEIKRYAFQANSVKPSLANEMMKILIDVQRAINVNLDAENSLCRFVVASIIANKRLAGK